MEGRGRRMKTISIDFDGTMTDIPEALAVLASSLRATGHRVILTTRRYDTEENKEAVATLLETHAIELDRVIFAGPLCKRLAVAGAGEAVDIWIDDQPESIVAMKPMRPMSQSRKASNGLRKSN
jgi:hypothetical protein